MSTRDNILNNPPATPPGNAHPTVWRLAHIVRTEHQAGPDEWCTACRNPREPSPCPPSRLAQRGFALALDFPRLRHVPVGQAANSTTDSPASQPDSCEGDDGPLPVPELWTNAEMYAALTSRNVREIYRLLQPQGFDQPRIALLTHQTPGDVYEILDGCRVDAYDLLAQIAEGLGIPRGYMGLAYSTPPDASAQ